MITPFLHLESIRIWNAFELFTAALEKKFLVGKKGTYQVDPRNPNLKL